MTVAIAPDLARREFVRRSAKGSLLTFALATMPTTYKVGKPTRAIAQALQECTFAVERGECRYIAISIPFRHGKSDLVSRRYGPWHLGRNPDHEFMLATYGQDLANLMSRDARRCAASEEFMDVFGMGLSSDEYALGRWSLSEGRGTFHAVGIGGPVTGKGATVLAVDDYCRSREAAESPAQKAATWDAFKSDLMTRLAPIHAVVIVHNRWAMDDLVGRIATEMKESPDFPRFEFIALPAKSSDYSTGYLFPERFAPAWYEAQFAALGAYAASAQLQQEPVRREGARYRVDRIAYHAEFPEHVASLRFVRFWDLASTEKERFKDDPDFTVGVKLAVEMQGDKPHIWWEDTVRGQWEAPERNRRIARTAHGDGSAVHQYIETVAGYKDTYTTLRDALRGLCVLHSVTPRLNKEARAAGLEPVFEAGNVHVLRAHWNDNAVAELAALPGGGHDDVQDGLSGAYTAAHQGQGAKAWRA